MFKSPEEKTLRSEYSTWAMLAAITASVTAYFNTLWAMRA